jgi:hypothetical protein
MTGLLGETVVIVLLALRAVPPLVMVHLRAAAVVVAALMLVDCFLAVVPVARLASRTLKDV